MRKKIVAGNWKMNNNLEESISLVRQISDNIKDPDRQIMIAPSFVNLYPVINELKNSKIEVLSQNFHQKENGAYTGEISVNMLKSLGIKTSIVGHSERREYFSETDEILKEKADIAIKNNLNIIFCIGEGLEDRINNNHFKIIEKQLRKSLFHIKQDDWNKIILAYEPIWAIGTGETASPLQAQEIHSFIRSLLKEKYNKELSENISIIYGGSCKSNNARELFSQKDIDGGLIGGASLRAKEFIDIYNSF